MLINAGDYLEDEVINLSFDQSNNIPNIRRNLSTQEINFRENIHAIVVKYDQAL